MAINKVVYNKKTLIDLTEDTVSEETLLAGTTAHAADGEKIEGKFDPSVYLKKTGDASDTTAIFTQAATRANIATGEKISVILGKIKKYLADLKAVAISGSASDLTSGTLSADRLPSIPVSKLSGTISSSNLPSYVDDVLEYTTKANFPKEGEKGKIYVDVTTNLTYRWSGTAYVEISPSLALGTTSATAYRGDYGNTAYQHSQKTSGNPHKVTKSDVGLGNVDNTADADKSVKYAATAGSAPANGGTSSYANYVNVHVISEKTNLNNITTPGFYYSPANAAVATFTNCPTKQAFCMAVGKHAGVYQEITEYMTGSPKKYIRNYYNNAWGSWYRVYTTADTPPDTKYTTMKGATSSASGAAGLVPAPASSEREFFLRGDGTWAKPETSLKLTSTQDLNTISGFNIFEWTTSIPKNAPKSTLKNCAGVSYGDSLPVQLVASNDGSLFWRVNNGKWHQVASWAV